MPLMNSITIGVCESCGEMGDKHYNPNENTVYCSSCDKKYNVNCSKCESVYDKRNTKSIKIINGKYICKNCEK